MELVLIWLHLSDVSRVSEIALQIYLRNGTKPMTDASNDELGKADIFMGNVTFVPDFDVLVRAPALLVDAPPLTR